MVKSHDLLVPLDSCLTAYISVAYQRSNLLRVFSPPFGGVTSNLGVGFALRCFQRLSQPDMATLRLPLARQQVHRRSVHSGPLVLGATPLKCPAPA